MKLALLPKYSFYKINKHSLTYLQCLLPWCLGLSPLRLFYDWFLRDSARHLFRSEVLCPEASSMRGCWTHQHPDQGRSNRCAYVPVSCVRSLCWDSVNGSLLHWEPAWHTPTVVRRMVKKGRGLGRFQMCFPVFLSLSLFSHVLLSSFSSVFLCTLFLYFFLSLSASTECKI